MGEALGCYQVEQSNVALKERFENLLIFSILDATACHGVSGIKLDVKFETKTKAMSCNGYKIVETLIVAVWSILGGVNVTVFDICECLHLFGALIGAGFSSFIEVGFFNPYSVVDAGNVGVIIYMVGVFQVFAQPLFAMVVKSTSNNWPNHYSKHKEKSHTTQPHILHCPPTPQPKNRPMRYQAPLKTVSATRFIISSSAAAPPPWFTGAGITTHNLAKTILAIVITFIISRLK